MDTMTNQSLYPCSACACRVMNLVVHGSEYCFRCFARLSDQTKPILLAGVEIFAKVRTSGSIPRL